MYYKLSNVNPIELVQVLNDINNSGTESSFISTQFKEQIIVKTSFDISNATAALALRFYDISDSIIFQSNSYTINNTGIQEGSKFLGSGITVDNFFGASRMKIILASSPTNNGTISVQVATK